MDKQHSAKFLRQRQFLLVAPLLVLPFLIMLFWALGGGKGSSAKAAPIAQKGINTSIPAAHLKIDRGENKMAYYEQADIDSAKLAEKLKNEAYYAGRIGGADTVLPQSKGLPAGKDPNEQKVYEKLNQLNQALTKATSKAADSMPVAPPPVMNSFPPQPGAVAGQEDPQLAAINRALDKLVAVQHPEILADSLRKQAASHAPAALPVYASLQDTAVAPRHTFHTLGNTSITAPGNTVQAIIPETQTLASGSTIKLELASDMYIAGSRVPKGTFVYGTAALNNERLVISINTIRSGNNIYPVSLATYDEDGMAGIYIPGSITRDVAKQSADEGLGSVGIASLDPSIGAQAAAAGIQLAKSVISKKAKLVRVTVQSGYRVLLKDTNQH